VQPRLAIPSPRRAGREPAFQSGKDPVLAFGEFMTRSVGCPVGARNSAVLRGLGVFVEQPFEAVTSAGPAATARPPAHLPHL